MTKRLTILAAIYPDQDYADTILDTLQTLHRASTLTLAALAIPEISASQ